MHKRAILVASGAVLLLTSPRALAAMADVAYSTPALDGDQERTVASFQELAIAQGALGFYFDADGKTMVVVTPMSRLSAVRSMDLGAAAVPVRIRASALDRQVLDGARDALRALMTYPAYEHESMSMQFDALHDKLVVTTTIDPTVLSRTIGGAWDFVDYRYGKSEVLTGRTSDSSPFNGGAKIKWDGSGNFCTSGFTVTNGSERAMLIPAHCGDVNTSFQTWSGTSIGTTGTDRHCGPANQGGDNSDFQFVRGKSYTDNIYLGTNPGFLSDVIDYGTPAIGAAYRFSGATTYETAAVEVVNDTDASFWIDPETACTTVGWWQLHVIAFSSDSVCDAAPGDSGAPFFARQGTNPIQVRLRGMITGREVVGGVVKAHCYAVKISNVTSLSGYWPITSD